MLAMQYEQFGLPPVLRKVDVPVINSHGALLRVAAAGICRSDWHGWMGHDHDINLPHVPGHEFSGVVVQVGSEVRNWQPGDRVTTPFVQACGQCRYCHAGDHQVCEQQEQAGFTHWGAFAEFVEVRHADVNLVAVPEGMSMEVAATLGCRFGTAYRAVLDQGCLRANQRMVVFGCGGVGLSAIMIGVATGAKVLAVDVNPKSRALAAMLGADSVVSPSDLNGLASKEFAGETDLTIDAVGRKEIIQWSLLMLRRRGRHVQVGLLAEDAAWSLGRVVAHELEIVGSHGIQSHKYREMMKFITTHQLPLDRLISKHCNLSEAVDILTSMGNNQHHGVQVITEFK